MQTYAVEEVLWFSNTASPSSTNVYAKLHRVLLRYFITVGLSISYNTYKNARLQHCAWPLAELRLPFAYGVFR